MNVLAEGFQDGYWIFTGLWAGEPAADLLLGLPSLAIHDQTFDGNVTGPALETVPSVCRG